MRACVAKNVVLAGVKSVTLYDPTPAEITDLSAQVRYEKKVLCLCRMCDIDTTFMCV